MKRIDTVKQYNDYVGAETLFPLISVIDFNEICPIPYFKTYMGVCAVFLKDVRSGDMLYWLPKLRLKRRHAGFCGSGAGVRCRQQVRGDKTFRLCLSFSSRFEKRYAACQRDKRVQFFSYQVNEALHLWKKERKTIVFCLEKIAEEIQQNIVRHSKTLIM
ncbi:hypothetical protein [Vaginella massiliensis]|uniref:hypothetical protein n=1 Tax=Vaginella massiliensis TaxID=1816680 RepID=UPI00293715F0|nr:hypothetical protein [Vaginella massiliensis]